MTPVAVALTRRYHEDEALPTGHPGRGWAETLIDPLAEECLFARLEAETPEAEVDDPEAVEHLAVDYVRYRGITLREPVLRAHQAGLAVVPTSKQKQPKVGWRRWQDRPQTWEEVADLGQAPLWAVVTGEAHGIVVLDFDGREGLETHAHLGLPVHVRTGSGGVHVYFRAPGFPVKKVARPLPDEYPGMDVQGEKGLAYFYGASSKGTYYREVWPPEPIEPTPEVLDVMRRLERTESHRLVPSATFSGQGQGTAVGLRMLALAEAALGDAGPGERNAALTKWAFSVAGLVASGQLDEEHTMDALRAAAGEWWDDKAEGVLAVQWTEGLGRPWIPEDSPRNRDHLAPGERYARDWIGAAERLIDKHGDRIRYAADANAWYVYDGRAWRHDAGDLRLQEMAKELVADIKAEATELEDLGRSAAAAAEGQAGGFDQRAAVAEHRAADAARKAGEAVRRVGDAEQQDAERSAAGLRRHAYDVTRNLVRVVGMAKSDPRIRVEMADLDRASGWLNTPTGIVDLVTGDVWEHIPEELLTKVTGAEWRADVQPGLWQEFLDVILPDPEMQAFVRRAAGYSALAGVKERLMVFPYGPSGTGKSKLLGALQAALGSYALATSTDLFLASSRDSYGLADLRGARFIAASEFDEDAKVNRSLVKRVTGGDTIRARHIYGAPFSFDPVGTIWIATNHLPWFGADDAAFARLVIVPFDQEIPPGRWSGDLADRLAREAGPEVLAWIIQGAREYQAGGLQVPESLARIRAEVKTEQDDVARFMDDCVAQDDRSTETAADIYGRYTAWHRSQGLGSKPRSASSFGRRLGQLLNRVSEKAGGGRKVWPGVRLIPGAVPGLNEASGEVWLGG